MGLHKTATSSFQNFLNLNRNVLLDAGVLYPEIEEHAGHWLIPYEILRNNWGFLEDYMKNALSVARQRNVKTVLISAEDFETLLLEGFRAAQFEKLACQLGYSEIHWICVLRNQWDYFNSLYAEKSKHTVCLNYLQAGEAVCNFGEISMAVGGFRWRFAFDYDSIIERFIADVRGSFDAISYDSFIGSRIVGAELIDKVIDYEPAIEVFWKFCANLVEKANIREDKTQVEMNYLANYFGIEPTEDNFSNNKNIFAPLLQNRLNHIDLVTEDLHNRFMERFPQISNRLK
jgi:hypothetical protein